MQESEEARPPLFSSGHVTAEEEKLQDLGSDSRREYKNCSNHSSFSP